MSSYLGTSAFGLRIPVIKTGDDIREIIVNTLERAHLDGEYTPKEKDIIGITESVVARSLGKYVTIDDIVKNLKELFPEGGTVVLYNPIFSRNRFSIILRSFARYFKNIIMLVDDVDEVGNTAKHQITEVDYYKLYSDICASEGCTLFFEDTCDAELIDILHDTVNIINCTLHPSLDRNYETLEELIHNEIFKSGKKVRYCELKHICNDVSLYGLLGSNKVDEETLKLFPDNRQSNSIINGIRHDLKNKFGLTDIEVMIYGDGCYKDADTGIWEFADPEVSPAFTLGLSGYPSELKLKYLADDELKDLSGLELTDAIKERIKSKKVVQGTMETQGTTPRRYVNLLGSLMDLISGSGDKGTPVVVVQDYFKNYSDE